MIEAHSTASPKLTSGSAGFYGGFLPAAAFHDRSSSFRVTAAAPSPATREKTVHTFELSEAMAGQYPGCRSPMWCQPAGTERAGQREAWVSSFNADRVYHVPVPD